MSAQLLELLVEGLAVLFYGVSCFLIAAILLRSVQRVKLRTVGREGLVLFVLDSTVLAITMMRLAWQFLRTW